MKLPPMGIPRIGLIGGLILILVCAFPISAGAGPDQGESVWVQSEGEYIGDDVTAAEGRRLALDRARKRAIEEAVGVQVGSDSLVMNYQLMTSVVRTTAQGFIEKEDVLDWKLDSYQENPESPPVPRYFVRIKALVRKETQPTDPSFEVDLRLNRSVYHPGDLMEVKARCAKDCFLTIFNVMADDSVAMLFPNRCLKNNFLKAGQDLVLPGEAGRLIGMTLEMALPKGKSEVGEYLMAVATKEPFDIGMGKFKEAMFESWKEPTGMLRDLVRAIARIPMSGRATDVASYKVTSKGY